MSEVYSQKLPSYKKKDLSVTDLNALRAHVPSCPGALEPTAGDGIESNSQLTECTPFGSYLSEVSVYFSVVTLTFFVVCLGSAWLSRSAAKHH